MILFEVQTGKNEVHKQLVWGSTQNLKLGLLPFIQHPQNRSRDSLKTVEVQLVQTILFEIQT